MGATVLGGAVMGLVVVTAVTAARGELNVTRAGPRQKQAYEAARAGSPTTPTTSTRTRTIGRGAPTCPSPRR